MKSNPSDGPRPVAPVVPVALWVGGKARLAKRLCAMIDDIPHRLYAEPFVGMGGVFFRRAVAAPVEVINDKSGDVANLFRILQRHYASFIGELKFSLTGRATFERLKNTAPDTLTDLERAARFLYLQRTSYGGRVTSQNFSVKRQRGGSFNLSTLEPMLADVHERLSGVVIECLDWADFVSRYDTQETLFFIDPPYYGIEGYYGRGLFGRGDYELMAERLAALKGTFILTLNDTPEVRRMFKAFRIEGVEFRYSVAPSATGQKGREVLITPRRRRARKA